MIKNTNNIICKNAEKTKKAFTLAEVLIVLGIIGVVVIFTIGPLQRNIFNYQMKQRLKVFNSTLFSALDAISLGEYDGQALIPVYQKESETGGPIMTSPNEYLIRDLKKYLGNATVRTPSTIASLYTTFEMKSGAKFGVYYNFGQWNFIVDLNGTEKPPNKEGYDYFGMVLSSDVNKTKNKILPSCPYSLGGAWTWVSGIVCSACGVGGNMTNCYQYALEDRSPTISGKGYWETLP